METKFIKQEWLREKTTVYSLHQIGCGKGEPIMSNKFYFQVYPDYRLEDAEQEAIKIAKRMAAADDMLDALIETDKDLCVLESNMRQIELKDHLAVGMTELVKKWRERNKEAIKKATE